MLRSNKPLLSLMASIFMVLAITACQSDDNIEAIDFDKPADHTVLMYLVGDVSNITGSIEENAIAAQKAVRDSIKAGNLNVLIFKDNQQRNDNLPILYWVHNTMKHELDTVIIKKWDSEIDASDPNVISEVINMAFSRFDTPIKGLVMGAHASGWVPKMNGAVNGAAPRPSFGLDVDTPDKKTHTCELPDFSEALLKCPHFDYLIMDCCHMGNAEVAYQMRDVARYMVGSPCEVVGSGMPYTNVFTRLARCKRVADLPEALDYGMRCYFNQHKNDQYGATIALYDLQKMEPLAQSYRSQIQANTDRLQEISHARPEVLVDWQKQFQHYGREGNYIHYRYYFYDLLDVAQWLDQSEAKQVQEALKQVVLTEYHTNHFLEIQIDHSCGMAVTVPELFTLAGNSNYSRYFNYLSVATLTSAYSKTDWGAYMGY